VDKFEKINFKELRRMYEVASSYFIKEKAEQKLLEMCRSLGAALYALWGCLNLFWFAYTVVIITASMLIDSSYTAGVHAFFGSPSVIDILSFLGITMTGCILSFILFHRALNALWASKRSFVGI